MAKTRAFLCFLKAFVLIVCLASPGLTQSPEAPDAAPRSRPVDLAFERAALVGELRSLEKETVTFNDRLAEALAKAEIADAAWQLDRDWAKELLRIAYELVLPKTEQDRGQDRPAGSIPPMPTAASRSRQKVRLRVLEIARRDKDLVNELVQLETENAGAYGKHFTYAGLADQSLEAGDVKASADYVLEGIKADPTQGTAPDIINRIALRDRTLADRLILQYVGELRGFPLSSTNQSDVRTFFILSGLINPYLVYDPDTKVAPPGGEVMRAYVNYMLEALNVLEQKEPGYLQKRRRILLSLWVALQRYAPERAGTFLDLESRSRRPGERLSLPTAAGVEEERRSRYERSVRSGLESDQPGEGVIYSATSRGDFDKARKMIDKLPDGARKRHLVEMVNSEEALSLLAKGGLDAAENLAKELRSTAAISKVYPPLIRKSVTNKDRLNTSRLVYQALRQVKDSDPSPPPAPEGVPTAAVANDQRFDPVLSFIAGLAADTLPYNAELASDVLDEFVSVANSTPVETGPARIGFDISVFKRLAPANEARTQQTAYSLRNPVQRVLALTAVYQWKAGELVKKQFIQAKTATDRQ